MVFTLSVLFCLRRPFSRYPPKQGEPVVPSSHDEARALSAGFEAVVGLAELPARFFDIERPLAQRLRIPRAPPYGKRGHALRVSLLRKDSVVKVGAEEGISQVTFRPIELLFRRHHQGSPPLWR